jgi:hypothetical protein
MWCALSDERTGLSFTSGAGPRQRSHSWDLVPWDSRTYFTVSDSRPPFSSHPTTRRVTAEVFDPAFTQEVLITTLHGPSRKHCFQQYLYCCMSIRFLGNMFTDLLSRSKSARYNIESGV